jgi:membrane AbrB-like protein
VFAIVVGYLSALVLTWLSGLDRTTALFASVPGGAAEMAVLGERHGARVDRVAAAQSLRILIVVITIPFTYKFLGLHGSDPYHQAFATVEPRGLLTLLALTAVGGLVFLRLGAPNAFVLGSLAVSIPLTAAQVHLSAMPTWLSSAAQLLIGCALASRFDRSFLERAHRFVGAVVVSVLVGIVLSAAFAALIGYASGLNIATLVLSTAPGGIAEMAVTAKVLQLGVPLVTAFHVTRVVVILLTTAPLFRRMRALRRARAAQDDL